MTNPLDGVTLAVSEPSHGVRGGMRDHAKGTMDGVMKPDCLAVLNEFEADPAAFKAKYVAGGAPAPASE